MAEMTNGTPIPRVRLNLWEAVGARADCRVPALSALNVTNESLATIYYAPQP